MGQKNKFIKVVGVSTAIALSNITTTIAQAPNVTAQQIAQESDTPDTEREIESGQQPISDVEKLNPSGNPLSFPTTSEEVQVDAQKPITLEQALQLSLKTIKKLKKREYR